MGKLAVGLALFGVALLSMLFTVFNYLRHPENREYFINRLENARNTTIFKEMSRWAEKLREDDNDNRNEP
ncbi:MAG: hypothetical protein GXN96_04165 [Aquificae bacterium]|nr:hypothetical protein [Aquificota bacterium]